MQEFSEIIKDRDIEAGAPNPGPTRTGNAYGLDKCPECGGSGFILRQDGRAQLCRCHAERRYKLACREARLQPALQKMLFSNFDMSNYPGNACPEGGRGRSYYELAQQALAKTRGCCEQIIAGQAPRGLLLLGQVGSGKTHLAAAAANYLLRRRQRVLFLVVPDFLDELRGSFSGLELEENARHLQEQAKKIQVLILDDLGSHNFSEWTRSVLFSILNYRMNECLTTIVTSNLDFADLQDLLGVRSLSRLLSLCEPCLLASDRDIRLRGLEKN